MLLIHRGNDTLWTQSRTPGKGWFGLWIFVDASHFYKLGDKRWYYFNSCLTLIYAWSAYGSPFTPSSQTRFGRLIQIYNSYCQIFMYQYDLTNTNSFQCGLWSLLESTRYHFSYQSSIDTRREPRLELVGYLRCRIRTSLSFVIGTELNLKFNESTLISTISHSAMYVRTKSPSLIPWVVTLKTSVFGLAKTLPKVPTCSAPSSLMNLTMGRARIAASCSYTKSWLTFYILCYN